MDVSTPNTAFDQTTAFDFDSLGRLKITTNESGRGAPEELASEVFYDEFGIFWSPWVSAGHAAR